MSYLSLTDADREAMLEAIGVSSVAELFRDIPAGVGFHTIEDGQLLFCAHTMWFPVVGYQFDVRSCATCDYFKPVRSTRVT